MALGVLKQIFKTSGKEAVLELVNRNYDFKINANEVNIEIYEPETTVIEAAMQIPDFDTTTMRTAIMTPVEGSRFHGKTFLQYSAIDAAQMQLDETFVLNIRQPITAEKVIDAMELKYGFHMEVTDLARDAKDVIWPYFGDCMLVIPNTSLRFYGSWNFTFINEDQIDLAAVVPATSSGNLNDLYTNPHTTTGMV